MLRADQDFIGSHLVEALIKEGHKVTIIDLNGHGEVWSIDISNATAVNAFFKYLKHGFDIIYHLAAKPWTKVVNEKEWIKESGETFNTNVIGTYNIIKNCGNALFVFSSTANIYGTGRKLKETSSINISSPYGYSKCVAEQIIKASMKPHVIYRFGTVVGIRGRCFPNRLVWAAINNVPIEIWGRGSHRRDIIDVRDLVSCLIVSEELSDGTYNVASGSEADKIILVEIVEEISKQRGHDFRYKYVDFKPPGYVPHSTLDISNILSSGLWKPKIKLKDTILSLFEYYEQNKDAKIPPKWDEL